MASTIVRRVPRALPKLTTLHQQRLTSLVSLNIARMATSGTRVATLDASGTLAIEVQILTNCLQSTLRDRLPVQAPSLFEAKAAKNLTFEDIAKQLGRNEVAVAAIFYGQAQTTSEDAEKLADILGVDKSTLGKQLAGYPFRGQVMDMPPKEPLIYRLYEIVQNYGYAYKAVLNEKFGDGIMSAISFSTKVEKETDKDGNNWAVITLRGKWYVNALELVPPANCCSRIIGCLSRDSKQRWFSA